MSAATNLAEEQFSTFYIADKLYGIDVTRVQEVVKPMPMTAVPLADQHIKGLINLRGQVATAVGLRELFEIPPSENDEYMNVVCNMNGNLIALLADSIGDVVEVPRNDFEDTPQTIPPKIRRFMSGVYKMKDHILSIIDTKKINEYLEAQD